MSDQFWTKDLSIEMRLEPVPLQLEHFATNRSRNHHSTHLGQNSVAGRQARLLQILDDHTVMRCSLLSTKGCQLMPTNPRCSGERCQYCDRFMSILLLRSQYNHVRLVCGLKILVQRQGLNLYLFKQSISLKTEVTTTIPYIQGKMVLLVDRLACCRSLTNTL